MHRQLSIFLILSLLTATAWQACSPRLTNRFASFEDAEIRSPEGQQENFASRPGRYCGDALDYAPDTNNLAAFPMKYVRVNIHFMNSADSTHNYNGAEAETFAKDLVHASNYALGKNHKMWLPAGNQTPVLPIRFRYELTGRPGDTQDSGVYCHYDDDLYYYVHKGKNANLFDREVIKRYSVQTDTVLNIFIMPHHPDSVASPTYSSGGVGVALGTAVKLAGVYENGGTCWDYRGLFNHEVGHIFGLSHTWAFNDGCDDTPQNPGCWNKSEKPPCDTQATNNVMDYNARQSAWTPCQIGRVHQRMAALPSRHRGLLVPTWCELKAEGHVFIRKDTEWRAAKDLEGNLTIEPGATLTVHCRISLPRGAVLTVRPGATLVLAGNGYLHNACGEEWEGIRLQQEGDREGRIVFVGAPAVENARHPVAPGNEGNQP